MNDLKSISAVVELLNKRGYKTSFKPCKNGYLLSSCGLKINPKDMIIEKTYRFEGETDMDEEAILFALFYPKEDIRGVYLVPFGSRADPIEAHIISLLKKSA